MRPHRVPVKRAQQKRHRCKRRAPRELPKDARAHRTEPLGGERVQDFAHVRVARDPLNARDGGPMALRSLFGERQERGRFEGHHGTGRHERIRAGHVGIVQPMSWQAGTAAADHVKEGIGGEMLPYVWCHDGHGTPRHEHSTIVPVRGYFRIEVYERPVQQTR